MTLPKIELPKFTTTLPSTGAQVEYWPMTIAQEKLLLLAKEGDGENDILQAIVDVVAKCTSDKIRPVNLPMCDINWLFLQIRKVSVSNIAELSYMEPIEDGDDKQHDFKVDLNQVIIDKSKLKDRTIKVNDEITITMCYTPVRVYLSKEYVDASASERFDLILRNSIDLISTSDNVNQAQNVPPEELQEWLGNLPTQTYTDIEVFLTGMPSLFYEVKYTDVKGEEQKIVLSELTDFFTF